MNHHAKSQKTLDINIQPFLGGTMITGWTIGTNRLAQLVNGATRRPHKNLEQKTNTVFTQSTDLTRSLIRWEQWTQPSRIVPETLNNSEHVLQVMP